MSRSELNSKELLFAIGALRGMGCSEAYATEIATRVLQPGALLNAGDAEWLALIRKAQRLMTAALDPRWMYAN